MKRQKRFWTWTKKNKQKSRNHKHSSDMIPKDYFNVFKSRYKALDEKSLKNELNGVDTVYSNWNRIHAEVSWMYW